MGKKKKKKKMETRIDGNWRFDLIDGTVTLAQVEHRRAG